MFQAKVHKRIESIIAFFYRVRIWHRDDEETVAKWRLKLFYSIYYFTFPLSLMAGAFASDSTDEQIFLVQASLVSAVVLVKLLYLIWRKRDILELINRICDYGVKDEETFNRSNDKLMKLVVVFYSLTSICSICIGLIVPFLGAERQIFFKIGFPLDYRTNQFAYWAAFIFILTHVTITVIGMLFSAICWYLMANCGLRYVVLGQQIKVMGERKSVEETPKRKISEVERDNLYLQDFLVVIATHRYSKELTIQLDSFLSKLFAVQLTTSGLCICASIYCLAFNRGENLFELIINLVFLFYNIFDIFMIVYFGNEIQLASGSLSYHPFESDWVDRSQSIKKNILIFGELLMKPHQLVVLKLYPLTLETFTRILNSAYSMFNILQNLT